LYFPQKVFFGKKMENEKKKLINSQLAEVIWTRRKFFIACGS